MHKVLVVAYDYPPLAGAGIIRTMKFTQHFKEFGWEPYILTVKNPDRFYTAEGKDPVPVGMKVYRSRNYLNNLSMVQGGLGKLGMRKKFIVPDVYAGWIFDTVRKAKILIREEGIDLIYVSCPPYSGAVAGAWLKRTFPHIPLVVDFRDAWTVNPYTKRNYLSSRVQAIDDRLERWVFGQADAVAVAADGIMREYVQKYPDHAAKMTVIYTGFDQNDIPLDISPNNKFTILYAGYFYGVQTPEPICQALSMIKAEGRISPDELEFKWIGRRSPYESLIEKYGLRQYMKYWGVVPKSVADYETAKADLFYLTIGQNAEVSQSYTLTNKIFSCLGAGKPILATVPEGDAKSLIEQHSDNSYIITDYDPVKIKRAIETAYARRNERWMVSEKTRRYRESFNHAATVIQLTDIMDQLVIKNE